MHTHRLAQWFCLTFAVAAAPALAQGVNANYGFAYGNAEVGGSFALAGSATRNAVSSANSYSYRHEVAGEARTDVRVAATTREAARVRVAAEVTNAGSRYTRGGRSGWLSFASARGDLDIFIGGQNMLSRTVEVGSFQYGNVSPTSLGGGISRAYGVGPFLVTTVNSVDAGASANVETMLSTSQQRAALAGNITTYANGRAELAFGIPGVSVGVTSDLRFANVRTNLSLDANPTARAGRIDWSVNPIRLLVQGFVTAGWSRYAQTIVDIAIGAFAGGRALG